MRAKRILIVDDEFAVRTSIEKALGKAGFLTYSVSSGNEALKLLEKQTVELVLSDLKMPDGDGLELLRAIKKKRPFVEVILLTGYGTIEKAVDAMKEGAYDFITKPFKKAFILNVVERALEKQNLTQENTYLKAQLGKSKPYEPIIGSSRALADVMSLVDRVAPLTTTVLITGSSGTGKELIARALHRKSPRADKRFIPINCGAMPDNLIESELFGHVKGSFTGAMRDKVGLFKAADGGTLFLDEISSFPLQLQVKLLRAIEQKEILPVGSTDPEIVDLRIIAATNKNLASEMEVGNFREDLYYRLNVVGIMIPPLKERVGDIEELVEHFIRIDNAQLNKQVNGVRTGALSMLQAQQWKGNVRELGNAIERAMILCDGDWLEQKHFSHLSLGVGKYEYKLSALGKDDLKGSLQRFEQQVILKALDDSNNDKHIAAEKLGLSLSTLYRKITELGIDQYDELT